MHSQDMEGRTSEQDSRSQDGGPDSGGQQNAVGGNQGQESSRERKKERPSRAEWVVGAICSAVVLVAVGYLFFRALSGPSLPPIITVHAERIFPAGQGYLVEIRVVNEGSETAATVMVEGSLIRDTVAVEKSTATIDFVPAGTERRGGLFFTRDPARYRLEFRPTGFDRP